jgi:hypothetical protein
LQTRWFCLAKPWSESSLSFNSEILVQAENMKGMTVEVSVRTETVNITGIVCVIMLRTFRCFCLSCKGPQFDRTPAGTSCNLCGRLFPLIKSWHNATFACTLCWPPGPYGLWIHSHSTPPDTCKPSIKGIFPFSAILRSTIILMWCQGPICRECRRKKSRRFRYRHRWIAFGKIY